MHAFATNLAILGLPGGWEWIVLLLIGLLLFGRRLPEVGRSLGMSIVEFKKGVKGVQDEIEAASDAADAQGYDRKLESSKSGPELQSQYSSPEAEKAPGRTVSTEDAV